MAEGHLLLTGATGFLGKVVLEMVLRMRPAMAVTLIVRPRGRHGAQSRFRRLQASPCFSEIPAGWAERVRVVEGDLSQPGAGLTAEDHNGLVAEVTHVVHCAASIDFDLPLGDALRANVDSALNVMELARACPGLVSVVKVSNAYVTPYRENEPILEEPPPLTDDPTRLYEQVRSGRIDETRLLRQTGRPNTYTLTKALCEHLLIRRYNDLPLTILRPSIISASIRRPFPGWIDSNAAFAAFVYLVGMGHLQRLVGDPRTRLDIVPCDVVAAHILDRLFDPPTVTREDARPRIVHSTVGLDQAATVREAGGVAIEFFRDYQVDRWPRIRYLGLNRFLVSPLRVPVSLFGAAARHLIPLRHDAGRSRVLKRRRQTEEINARFQYFMLHSFDFRSSLPWPDQPLDPRGYIRTICRGVYRHMMRRREETLLVGGRQHRRVQSDLQWFLTRPAGGFSTRLSLLRIRRRLAGWAQRITVDEPALASARREAPAGSVVLIYPVVGHSRSTAALLSAFILLARRSLGFGAVWVVPEADLPEEVHGVLQEGAFGPPARRRPWVLAARDDSPEAPYGTVHDDPDSLRRFLAAGARLVRVDARLDTDPDEHTLSQQEDASSLLLGAGARQGGTVLLRVIARSLPAHHGHVRSAHIKYSQPC